MHGLGLQEMKNIAQRKTVLLRQSDVEPIVGSRRLQLEVEPAAEALAQSQSPGLVDSSAEWRMDYKLHAAALIKEAFRDHGRLGRHRAQNRAPLQDVFNRLLRTGIIKSAFILQPAHGRSDVGLRR